MKIYFSLLVFFFTSGFLYAQDKKTGEPKKPNQSTTPRTNKMLEDVMNQEGMTEAQKAEMRKSWNQANQTSDLKKPGEAAVGVSATVPKIPTKQTIILSKIAVVETEDQLAAYLKMLVAECQKNIPAELISQVDDLISGMNGDTKAAAGLPLTLFLSRNIKAAVYAGLKLAQTNNIPIIQNNCAFVLHQAGYPNKAVTIFKYLCQKNEVPEFNNNLGQCYLSLGDKENAKKYFRIGLSQDPRSSEMHCGMGLILSEEGNSQEASVHIAESLKEGYSMVAEALADKHKVKMKFSDMRVSVPEYFNPQKFKPVQPASVMEEMPQVEADRKLVEERYSEADRRNDEMAQQLSASQTSSIQSLPSFNLAYAGTTPFGRKAWYMMKLLTEEKQKFFSDKMLWGDYTNRNEAFKKQFEEKFEKIQHTSFGHDNDWAAKQCAAHVENLNTYLKNTKSLYENFEREVLPKMYDFTNQALYWQAFLVTGDAYKQVFYAEVKGYYGYINGLSQMQSLYPTPAGVYSSCKNYKKDLEEMEKMKLEEIQDQFVCPVNFKVNQAVGSAKLTCRGWELDGGELLKFGLERDYRTGEFTIGFGLGADIPLVVGSAGVKGMMCFKFAKDLTPVDMQIKGEASLEGGVGIFYTEEKISATMGISSINIDAVHKGKESNLFSMDATKD